MRDDLDALDSALGAIVAQGWEDGPTEPDYPPVPVREPDPPAPVPEGERGMMDIGLLADLAAGRKTADEAARFAGVSVDEIQASLAVALREVPPEEIAKAMGLQAAEQQLKSGAIYGAVLADLVADMAEGRLKPEHKLDLARLLSRVGRIEPKEEKGAGVGGGFRLNIVIGGDTPPVIVEAE